jgi:NADPH:quinone reductase-like Zn-dependent oxidoreductase
VKDAFFIVEPSRAQLERVAGLIDAGVLQAVAGAVLPIAQASRAYRHKPARGKTVLTVLPSTPAPGG